jgi:hypothetical protein
MDSYIAGLCMAAVFASRPLICFECSSGSCTGNHIEAHIARYEYPYSLLLRAYQAYGMNGVELQSDLFDRIDRVQACVRHYLCDSERRAA